MQRLRVILKSFFLKLVRKYALRLLVNALRHEKEKIQSLEKRNKSFIKNKCYNFMNRKSYIKYIQINFRINE